jgi:peroxiredoxin
MIRPEVTPPPFPVRSPSLNPERSGKTSPPLPIGEIPPPIPALTAANGLTYSLQSFGPADIVILAFLGDACPAVKACVKNLVEIQQTYLPQHVYVVGVNSNNPFLSPQDSLTDMTGWAVRMGLNFPYLKDPNGVWARAMGVTNTPHFVVLDRERRLQYRGRMFDSRDPAKATTRDLQEAIESVLHHRRIEEPENPPLGCSIVW